MHVANINLRQKLFYDGHHWLVSNNAARLVTRSVHYAHENQTIDAKALPDVTLSRLGREPNRPMFKSNDDINGVE